MTEAVDSKVDHGLLNQLIDRALRDRDPVPSGGSGGGGADAWQQSVENRLSDLQAELRALRSGMLSQFRWLLGFMLGGFTGLMGVMARGFGWL